MAPPRPPTQRDKQREETRKRLFDAALSLIRRQGVEAARIEDIAILAGVSRATFYFHYPSKDDVLVERLDGSQAVVAAQLEALPADAPVAAVLEATAVAIAAEWQDDPALLRAVGTVALRLTAQSLPEGIGEHRVHQALLPRFQQAAARGELAAGMPPDLLTGFFLVNLFAAALAWCAEPVGPLEPVLRGVVAFFLRGAGADPAAASLGATPGSAKPPADVQ